MAEWSKAGNVSSLQMINLSWSSLRAATLVSRMGMVNQAYPVQRQALEALVYSLLFRFDASFHELWMNRHLDHKAKAKFRREHWRRAISVIEEQDTKMSEAIVELHQTLIDFGAHPNPISVGMMSEYRIDDGAEVGTVSYSMLLVQPYVDVAHVQTANVYLLLLDSLSLIWPDRMEIEDVLEKAGRARLYCLDLVRTFSST